MRPFAVYDVVAPTADLLLMGVHLCVYVHVSANSSNHVRATAGMVVKERGPVMNNLAPPLALLTRALSTQSLATAVAAASLTSGASEGATEVAGAGGGPDPSAGPSPLTMPLVLAYPTPYLPYAYGVAGVSVVPQAGTPALSAHPGLGIGRAAGDGDAGAGAGAGIGSVGGGNLLVDAGLTPSLLTVSATPSALGSPASGVTVVSAFAGAGECTECAAQ